jgi:hypothetical protein
MISEKDLLEKLLDNELRQKYIKFKKNIEVQQDKNKAFCPSLTCNGEVILTKTSDPTIKCANCT